MKSMLLTTTTTRLSRLLQWLQCMLATSYYSYYSHCHCLSSLCRLYCVLCSLLLTVSLCLWCHLMWCECSLLNWLIDSATEQRALTRPTHQATIAGLAIPALISIDLWSYIRIYVLRNNKTHSFLTLYIGYCVHVYNLLYCSSFVSFLPRDALYCKARCCYCTSSVRPSVRLSVTLVDQDSGSHRLEILKTNCTHN